MKEYRLSVTRSARYFTTGRAEREVWFVLHGYGQLAARFLSHFESIDDGTRGVTAASKQIRRRNGFGVQELAEDHARTPDRFAPMTAKARAVFSFDVPRKQS